jgi:hypothetical protein
MSFLKKLFGGGASAPETRSETYNGFTITPTPIREGSRFRISALIEKDGRTHTLIRADVLEDLAAASEASIGKAKQMIDEQGERLFG